MILSAKSLCGNDFACNLVRYVMNKQHRFLLVGLLLASSLTLPGCFTLQRAMGCNNVGLFGCKDNVETPPQRPEAYPELKRAPESGRLRNRGQNEIITMIPFVGVLRNNGEAVSATHLP